MKKLILSILFALIALAGYAQHQFTRWVPTSGTDTYTATITVPSYTAYTNSKPNVKFGNTNTGAATININSIGAIALRMWDGNSWEPLTAGQIDVNTIYELAYTGTYFQMQSFGSGGGPDTNTSFNSLPPIYKVNDFTTVPGDTVKMLILKDDCDIVTLGDFSAVTTGIQIVMYNDKTDEVTIDPDGQVYKGSLTIPDSSFAYIYYASDTFRIATANASSGGSSSLTSGSGITIDSDSINLRGTLTRNAVIVVPTGKRFEVSRVSGFNFTLNNSGASLTTQSTPLVLGTTTGSIEAIINGVTRIDLDNHNDYSTSSGTNFHRFFIPGAGAQIRLMEESGSGTSYIALAAPTNVTTTQTYTFPAAGPSNNGDVLASTTGGTLSWITPSGGVSSVSGTTNRITSTGGTTPVIDISGSYVGQSSITTVGTITTGVWNGTAVALANQVLEGTNTSSSLTDAGTVTITGPKHTLTSDEATITWTLSQTQDFQTTDIILNATSTTWTFPANTLCVVNGIPSGDNVAAVADVVSGDHLIMSIWKDGANYRVAIKNFGQ